LNTRFLDALIWVARLHSFRAAAEQLHVTQAAISNRISALEEELGVQLFERDSREVRLTDRGRQALAQAEQILRLERELKVSVTGRSEVGGMVRVGCIESIAHSWLVPMVRELAAAHPRLSLELTIEPTSHLHAHLLRGNLDVALQTDAVVEEDIVNRSLGAMPMAWFAGPEAARAIGDSLWEQVLDLPVITFTRGSQPHANVLRDMESVGEKVRQVHCVTAISVIRQLARQGFGVATLPSAVTQDEVARGELVQVASRIALRPLELVLSYRRDATRTAIEVVVEGALQHATRFSQSTRGALATPP
jgi:DNA-binding transcriptional LysR family regulator